MSRFLAVLAGIVTFAAPAFAAGLPPETATYGATATYEIGNDRYSSTVTADHGRERRVIETPYGPQTVLIDPGAGKAYLLGSPIGTLALSLSSPEAGLNLAQLYTAEAQPVGRETIDGLEVTKYRLTASPAANASFTGDVWSTADGIFVKIDGTGTYRGQPSHIAMRLTGIRRGPQDPSSFALPRGGPILDAGPLIEQFLRPRPN